LKAARVSPGTIVSAVVAVLVCVSMFTGSSFATSDTPPDEAGDHLASQLPPEPPAPRPAPAQIPGASASTQPAPSMSVTGVVTYRERIALPPNAVVQVSLRDISLADAPAVVLGEQTIITGGNQVPIPFAIAYDPAAIDPRFTYAVSARITVDGQLLFTSMTTMLVITHGHPTHVEIVVQHV